MLRSGVQLSAQAFKFQYVYKTKTAKKKMENQGDGMGLEILKEEYEKLSKKYRLPGFREMNEDFYIEKIAENETEILIREVRRMVGDRLANYMRLLENILNPVNVPMFIFSIIKLIGPEEKKRLSEIYKKLIKSELKFIEIDLDFNEAKEAEFIKESYSSWQEIKKEMSAIFEKAEKKWDIKDEGATRDYFG